MEEMPLFVRLDLKLKDVPNLEQYQHTGAVCQIVMSEAVNKNKFQASGFFTDLKLNPTT